MKRLRAKLTYSNVIATLALFVALGGASFAATQLPKNSVGTKQLKKNAVTGAKVRNGSLAAQDFGVGELPAGRKGDTGPQGPPGSPGEDATNLFAYISDEGPADAASVAYGSGVTGLSDPAGNNNYSLTFDRSVVNCVVQAVAGYGNPAGSADVDEEAIPTISMETGPPNEVDVFFNRPGPSVIDTSFLVTAFC